MRPFDFRNLGDTEALPKLPEILYLWKIPAKPKIAKVFGPILVHQTANL